MELGFYTPGLAGHQQSSAGRCTGCHLGAAAKPTVPSAPSARNWGTPAPSSLLRIPSALSPVHAAATSSARRLSPLAADWDRPQHQPGEQGRCLQLPCEAGDDVQGTQPCPAPAPLRAAVCIMENHGRSLRATGWAPRSRSSPSRPGPAQT